MSGSVVRQEVGSQAAAIWTRQPKESEEAWSAFVVYREQAPPRSIARAARSIGKATRTLNEFSRKNRWVERAAAYTDHLDRIVLAANEQDIIRRRREENERLYNLGRSLQDKGATRMEQIAPEVLDSDDVTRWVELGTKLVRLSLGLPTDVSGQIQVNLRDVERILGGFLALAQQRMSPETYETLVRDCYALVRETLGE